MQLNQIISIYTAANLLLFHLGDCTEAVVMFSHKGTVIIDTLYIVKFIK